jgi:hypothetical protein
VLRIFVFSLIGVTSLGAFALGANALGLRPRRIGPALLDMLEVVGATVAFAAINVVVGAGAILALRSLTRWFLPLYLAADTSLLVFSLFQAVTFCAWRAHERRHGGAR